jgi:ABC-type xylose transport system permease subunit
VLRDGAKIWDGPLAATTLQRLVDLIADTDGQHPSAPAEPRRAAVTPVTPGGGPSPWASRSSQPIALSLVVPLSGRIFDLSVGEAMGQANMLIAWLLVDKGWGIVPAVVITLLAGVAMGVFNGLVVVKARIDSFIGTLATGALFATLATVLGDQSISGPQLNGSFADIATDGLAGIEVPVFLTLAVAVVLWYFQKYTASGRRIFALGIGITQPVGKPIPTGVKT